LTFPMTRAREMGELNEILIDRISPQDAHTLAGIGRVQSLKGIGFGHFAAFLSRAYRENDYLLGRLHALERLIDIVCDAAGIDPKADGIDVLALKKRGFAAILAAEGADCRVASLNRRDLADSPSAPSVDQPENDKEDNGADRGRDDRRNNAGAEVDSQLGQQPASDEGADDTDADVGNDAVAGAANNLSGQPARDQADQQNHENRFVRHARFLPFATTVVADPDNQRYRMRVDPTSTASSA
jgi:hypothetical protein